MRGWPHVRLGIICLFLLVIGIPVYSLTRPHVPREQPTPPTPSSQHETRTEIAVEIESILPLDSFSMHLHGKPLLDLTRPETTWSGHLPLPKSREPLEIVTRAVWQSESRNAVRISIALQDGTVTQTFWGNEEIADIFELPPTSPE